MNKKTEESFIIKFIEETGHTRNSIEQLIKDKQNELKGLISREGAYLIVMREFGITDSIISVGETMSEITKEKIEITEEQKAIEEEVNEIQQDNKELYKIMKTDLYKALFQVLKRVTLKVEIVNLDKISMAGPGEKITTKKEKKPTLKTIECKEVKELENSYMITDDKGKIAFIGKSLISEIDDDKLTLNSKAQKWFTKDKIKWQEPQE